MDFEGQRLFKAEKDADKAEAEEEEEPQAEGDEPSEGEVKTEAGWKVSVDRNATPRSCMLHYNR